MDKWAARYIARDLTELGAVPFLDEKDIETGDSIDDRIQEHLADCDEILMLLSPESIKSSWVLIEIGGAKALRKRLIPIMLHISANDIPKAISLSLARDINDIERYFEELRTRMGPKEAAGSGKSPAPRSKTAGVAHDDPVQPKKRPRVAAGSDRPARPRAAEESAAARPVSPQVSTSAVIDMGDGTQIQPGDVVRIQDSIPVSGDGLRTLSWTDEMVQYLGRLAHVMKLAEAMRSVPFVKLDIDGGEWSWSPEWLTKVDLSGSAPTFTPGDFVEHQDLGEGVVVGVMDPDSAGRAVYSLNFGAAGIIEATADSIRRIGGVPRLIS